MVENIPELVLIKEGRAKTDYFGEGDSRKEDEHGEAGGKSKKARPRPSCVIHQRGVGVIAKTDWPVSDLRRPD
jgi:hypothetical protein